MFERYRSFKIIIQGITLTLTSVYLAGCVTVNSQDRERLVTEDVFSLASSADKAYVESRWLDAAREYRKLAKLVPQDSYPWFRLGNTYAQQGSFDKAISAYQSSLKRNPNQPKPWYNLATAHLLNAQMALRKSYFQLRVGDPARDLIEEQLRSLDNIIYQRVEDIETPQGGLANY